MHETLSPDTQRTHFFAIKKNLSQLAIQLQPPGLGFLNNACNFLLSTASSMTIHLSIGVPSMLLSVTHLPIRSKFFGSLIQKLHIDLIKTF